jgi:ATP-binding cassette subfamily B protein
MKKIIQNNMTMLGYVWKTQKIIFIVAALFCVCDIISPFQDTYLPKMIIDQLSNANIDYGTLLLLVVLFLIGSLYKVIMYPLYKNYYIPIAKAKVAKALNIEMVERNKKLDLDCFENEAFFNKYTRASKELDSRAFGVFESVISLIRYIIYICVLCGIIVILDPMLLIIAIICAIISAWANKLIAKLTYDYNNSLTAAQRGCDYCKRILYIPDYAKETRFFPVTSLIKSKYENYFTRKIDILNSSGKKITLYSIIPDFIITILLHGIVVAYLIWKIKNGYLTPGDFIALLLATSQFSNQLAGLGNQLNSFYSNSLYIDNINKLFDYESEIEDRKNGLISKEFNNTIEFNNVSFSYNRTSKLALKEINLNIKRGEKIAIVGLNGSGKSTLIKLLLNLYQPTNGTIEMDGTNIMKLTTDTYRRNFGVVFQDYHCLAFSIVENILIQASENINTIDREKVDLALKKVGMFSKIHNLKDGVDTYLSRELSQDGHSFSGGETQSLMLARLFVGEYSILILDEPSSSLDPQAEYRLYNELFEKKNTDQTVIIISHKLITTQNADKIYYMENGEIIESGKHNELMALGGKYAQLYNIQKQYYLTDDKNDG